MPGGSLAFAIPFLQEKGGDFLNLFIFFSIISGSFFSLVRGHLIWFCSPFGCENRWAHLWQGRGGELISRAYPSLTEDLFFIFYFIFGRVVKLVVVVYFLFFLLSDIKYAKTWDKDFGQYSSCDTVWIFHLSRERIHSNSVSTFS